MKSYGNTRGIIYREVQPAAESIPEHKSKRLQIRLDAELRALPFIRNISEVVLKQISKAA